MGVTIGNKLNDIKLVDLREGKEIECISCHNGHYVPDHPEIKEEFYYHCSECGEKLSFEPVIDTKKMFGL